VCMNLGKLLGICVNQPLVVMGPGYRQHVGLAYSAGCVTNAGSMAPKNSSR